MEKSIKTTISEEILNTIDEMCVESLSPDVYSMWKDEVVPNLRETRRGLKCNSVFISPNVKFHCKSCNLSQEIYPIELGCDDNNPDMWADIVCKECNFIIATVSKPKPAEADAENEN